MRLIIGVLLAVLCISGDGLAQEGLRTFSNGEWVPKTWSEDELAEPGRLCIRRRNYWCVKGTDSDPWVGQVSLDERGHAEFESAALGARAFFRLMRTYHQRHGLRSMSGIVRRYAPYSDCRGSLPVSPVTGECPQGRNPTAEYVASVAGQLGVGVDEDIGLFYSANVLNREVAITLARAVAMMEIGAQYRVDESLLEEGARLAGLELVTVDASFLAEWAETYFENRIERQGRYLEQDCSAAPASFFDVSEFTPYRGLPVLRCAYTVNLGDQTLSGLVYLLNPTSGQLGGWVSQICDDEAPSRRLGCARLIARQIWVNNNAQFPVAGIVIEPRSSGGGDGGDHTLTNFEFRHGVTIRSDAGIHYSSRQLPESAIEDSIARPIVQAMTWARVFHTCREAYAQASGDTSVGMSQARQASWAGLVRDDYIALFSGGRSDLLLAAGLTEQVCP